MIAEPKSNSPKGDADRNQRDRRHLRRAGSRHFVRSPPLFDRAVGIAV
jgi:hypothetical protein